MTAGRLLACTVVVAAALGAAATSPRARSAEDGYVVAVAGDLLLGRGVAARAGREGWPRVLRPLGDAFAGAHASVANLESPLRECLPGGTTQRPRLCGDPHAAQSLSRTGLSAVGLANNHALDAGEVGLAGTTALLKARGISVLGADAARTGAPVVERLGPIHVLSANLTRPAWSPGRERPIPSPSEIAAAIRRFRGRAPDDPLLVLMHGGREMDPTPSSFELAYAQVAVAAGASAVVFHGAHVRRPLVWIEGVPVHLGLGNLLFDQRDVRAREGEILLLRFRPKRPAEIVEARRVETLTGRLGTAR